LLYSIQTRALKNPFPTFLSLLPSFLYKNSFGGVYQLNLNIELTRTNPTANWLESLYREKAASLILYGRALGLSHAEAEDVLQETFIALLELSVSPPKEFAYCVRAFRNRALNYRRSLWRRIARELASQAWFEQEHSDDSTDRVLMAALAELPRDQREVIVLKTWHEYTFEEIGALIEISPNTAAGRYRYGINKMKNSLTKRLYEHDERIGEAFALLDTPGSFRKD
jgi:RNA polymerase sigma-70 factor (ECF subfamily)